MSVNLLCSGSIFGVHCGCAVRRWVGPELRTPLLLPFTLFLHVRHSIEVGPRSHFRRQGDGEPSRCACLEWRSALSKARLTPRGGGPLAASSGARRAHPHPRRRVPKNSQRSKLGERRQLTYDDSARSNELFSGARLFYTGWWGGGGEGAGRGGGAGAQRRAPAGRGRSFARRIRDALDEPVKALKEALALRRARLLRV
jgi:hypothetical protein